MNIHISRKQCETMWLSEGTASAGSIINFHDTDLINQDPVTIKGHQVGLHHLQQNTTLHLELRKIWNLFGRYKQVLDMFEKRGRSYVGHK